MPRKSEVPNAAPALGWKPGLGAVASAAVLILSTAFSAPVWAQGPENGVVTPDEAPGVGFFKLLAGAGLGLGLHEAGHLLFDWTFDAKPEIKRVKFGRIPFFAISPRAELSRRREFIISAAGFWAQDAASEYILSHRPHLRTERGPIHKGLLAFHVVTSLAYAVAAFGRAGPAERDTRGMASASGIDERWIGILILAPAVFDGYRYARPDARWAVWASRAAKIGVVGLVLR